MSLDGIYKGQDNAATYNRLLIPIGGWCGPATQTRGTIGNNVLALPFDYNINTFDAIINTINSDFTDMFSNPQEIQVGPDKAYLTSEYFYWIHHDITEKENRDVFTARCQRFMRLLNCGKDVIFYRSCTQNITKELEYVEDFRNMMANKSNLKSWKLILVTQNYHEDCSEMVTLRMNMDNQIYVFCINGFHKHSVTEPEVAFHNNYPAYINYNTVQIMSKFLKEEEDQYKLTEWTEEEKNMAPYDNGYTGNTYDSHTTNFLNIIDTAEKFDYVEL